METTIGRTIKVLRTALGLKQAALANQVGISPNYLSMIEAGRREPTLKLLRALGATMKVPLSVLLAEAVEPSEATSETPASSYDEIKQLILETQRIILENRGAKENG